MSSSVSVLLGFLLAGCSSATLPQIGYPDVAPGRYTKTLETVGFQRSYILRVPQGYDRAKPTPLVMMLHGYTGIAGFSENLMGAAVEKAGWIGLYPNGLGDPKGWNAGFLNLTGKNVDDVKFLAELLDETGKQLNVDRNRVYIAGHSNGAMMAHLLAARLSDRIAAIGAVAGITGLTRTSMIPKPVGPVSVLMIHGTADTTVAYGRSSNALLTGIPVLDGASWWAKANEASSTPVIDNKGKVTTRTWSMGKDGTEVRLISVDGMGHEWPSAPQLNGVDAPAVLIEFFQKHPK